MFLFRKYQTNLFYLSRPAAQGRPMVLQAGPNGQQVLRPLLSTTTGTALPAGSIVVGPTPVVTTGTPQVCSLTLFVTLNFVLNIHSEELYVS